MHVEHDAADGTFKGLPKAWRDALPEQVVANDRDRTEDYLKDVPGFLLPTNYKMRRDQSDAVDDSSGDSFISLPYNFQHIKKKHRRTVRNEALAVLRISKRHA